jgi:translation initiation factor 1
MSDPKKGFGSLAGMFGPGGLPPGPAPAPAKAPPGPKIPGRAVVRLERKGRRGKETTIVEKLALPPAELESWCRDFRRALGCGGTVEDDTIVLQGDLRPRVEAILIERGVKKVTVS